MKKILLMTLSFFCVCSYAYSWYEGALVPAWQPLIWCAIVFLHDLSNYIEDRFNEM